MSRVDEAALGSCLARHLDGAPRVDGLRRLSGGASRETWAFDAVFDDGRRDALVLRRDPGGGAMAGGLGRFTEYQLLEVAHDGGVPVPQVRFALDEGDDLGSGFVMERIEGETIPRKILRDDEYAAARPLLAGQCGEIAARIHAIDPDKLPELPGFEPHDHPARAQLEQYRGLLDAFGEPHPVFELGLQWLEERIPPLSRAGLVHGDFRNGNFIVGPEGVRAVLDWELAHLGDPMDDIAWRVAAALPRRSSMPTRTRGGGPSTLRSSATGRCSAPSSGARCASSRPSPTSWATTAPSSWPPSAGGCASRSSISWP